MWFDERILDQLVPPELVPVDALRGFVLPHAGVQHTWPVLAHTFRFRPTMHIKQVAIFYLPSQPETDYVHEYDVVRQVCDYFMRNWWGITDVIRFVGVNVLENHVRFDDNHVRFDETFVVISSDFSHFLPFSEAIPLENRAAHALLFKQWRHPSVRKAVDDGRTFEFVFEYLLPSSYFLRWVGRSRSAGEHGVGYLSFLILDASRLNQEEPVSVFVTCFDDTMTARECLGEWFTPISDRRAVTANLFRMVVKNGQTTSRLTGGRFTERPIKYCMITYLFPDRSARGFVRGWHGVRGQNAFYLPDVFLENTFENGEWIDETQDIEWQPTQEFDKFDMRPTLHMLASKASKSSKAYSYDSPIELFTAVSRFVYL